MRRPQKATGGHNLLEALIATGIFVLVSIALSGVWVMYGRSLAKSGEVLAANAIARSVTEGLTSNGWDWLKDQDGAAPADTQRVVVKRMVRGRQANIHYDVTYELAFNNGGSILSTDLSEDLCSLTVRVRWHSNSGSKSFTGTDFNNESIYTSYVYRHGI